MLQHFLLLAAACSGVLSSSPVVTAPFGTIQGSTLTARNGKTLHAFRGIPYAEPPLGNLRFRDPVPALPVEEVYNASDFKPYCIQLNLFDDYFAPGQEDCLYLNIFTPEGAGQTEELKKVLVFFHGGGNMNGFTDLYDPGTFVTEQDMIVVTPAYRLGYFGFLSTKTPSCTGNFALKDQLMALSWVKANIQSFGGDPHWLSISGESAGGMDVSLLSLASTSRDLFARVHPQSGVAGIKNFPLSQDPLPSAFQLGEDVGCLEKDKPRPETETELEELVECLRDAPAEKFPTKNFFQGVPVPGPVVDGEIFPKDIRELFEDEEYLQSIKFFDRDYMVGIDSNEGALFEMLNEMALEQMTEEQRAEASPEKMLRGSIQQFFSISYGQISQTVIENIAEYYTEHHEVSPVSDVIGDLVFFIPALQWVRAASKFQPQDNTRVRLFYFDYSPNYVGLEDPIYFKGLMHGLDLGYEFDFDFEMVNKILTLKLDPSKWTEEDEMLKRKYSRMLADFYKTGKPDKSLKKELPSGWPTFNSQDEQYLKFGLEVEVRDHLKQDRYELFSEIIPKWIDDSPLELPKDEL